MALIYNTQTGMWEEEETQRPFQPESFATLGETAPADVPSGPSTLQYLVDWYRGLRPEAAPPAPFVGEGGISGLPPYTPVESPVPPAQSPIPQERYPVAGQLPGGPPLDVGDPAYAIKKLYSDLAKGGVRQITIGDPKEGTAKAKISLTDPESEAVKKQRKEQEKRGGITQQVYPGAPSGPMETGVRQAGPDTLGGGYRSPEDFARERGQKAQFVSPLRPGEAPPSPEEWEARRTALLDKRTAALKENLRRTYPKRGELLNQAYEKLAKTSKLQRGLMAFLRGNPWWTDEQAGIEADYLALRAKVMGDAEAGIITSEYDERKLILEGLETRQKDKMAKLVKEFDERVELEPHLKYNKEAAKFQARRMGVPELHLEEFVEDRKDPKTGAYIFIRPAGEERVLRTKQIANEVLLLNPMLPPEVAMIVAQRPSVLAEIALNEIKFYETKALYEKDLVLKKEYKDRADREKNLLAMMMHDPAFRTYMMIADDLEYNGDKMDAATKAKAQVDLVAKHQQVFGQSPERDPEKLYMDKKKDEVYIRNAWAEARLKEQALAEKKEQPEDNILLQAAKKVHPGLTTHKPTQKVYDAAYTQQNMTLHMMKDDKIPPAPKDLTKEPAGNRELRREAEEVRKAAWKFIPPDVQKEIGTLSYPEAANLVEDIFNAQVSIPKQVPNIPFLIDRHIRSRRNVSQSKKK